MFEVDNACKQGKYERIEFKGLSVMPNIEAFWLCWADGRPVYRTRLMTCIIKLIWIKSKCDSNTVSVS